MPTLFGGGTKEVDNFDSKKQIHTELYGGIIRSNQSGKKISNIVQDKIKQSNDKIRNLSSSSLSSSSTTTSLTVNQP